LFSEITKNHCVLSDEKVPFVLANQRLQPLGHLSTIIHLTLPFNDAFKAEQNNIPLIWF